MSVDAFFFADDLFGVWRGVASAQQVWVLAPPFGEEEKSARRTLTDIALAFQKRGESSLLFSFRGCGDSKGDFARVSLIDWRADLTNAIAEAKRRAPEAEIGLLGVRLGASLCLQVATAQNDVTELVLIEPLLSGRSFLSQQMMRQKIRAQMTGEASAEQQTATEWEDLDGWPLGPKMKSELQALDLMKQSFEVRARTRIFQVGPKTEVAPPLRALSEKLAASAEAIVMPPFWNLLDYSDAASLLRALSS
ncbi:hypothetical protein IAD21_01287 [Abditibacteriota bacterium]|nr:hypothetical protein IAD21_01287 [Abditibacteriota bacterium]